MSDRSSEPVEIEVMLHHETAEGSAWRGAMLVSLSDDKTAEKVWLPKSQVKERVRSRTEAEIETITIPEWLAVEKGLVLRVSEPSGSV
jgi:hypothetical protein